MSRGLLTHLADRFVTQREDLATEALLFVLHESPNARAEVVRLLNDLGCSIEGSALFRSQATGDGGERPDLVGVIDGAERLLFEAKFWAGLTNNQPVAYLSRVEEAGGDTLVFIAPERRLEILWIELEKRIHETGGTVGLRSSPFPGTMAATVGGVQLAAVSWRVVLSRIERVLAASGEAELLESLGQLQTLCEREDRDAFLPIAGDELTSSFPRRLQQFGILVDDAVARLVGQGVADTNGLRAAAGNGWYGRYVHLDGAGCLVHVSGRKWADVESTPIWVRVKDRNWEISNELRSALDRAQSSGKLRFVDLGEGLEVPISLLLGRDRADVLDDVVRQLEQLIHVLSSADLPAPRSKAGSGSGDPTTSE
jgi:hypothetical protein